MKPDVRMSSRQCLAIGLAAVTAFSGLVTTPATAGGGDVAAGLLGGLAVGTIVGSAASLLRALLRAGAGLCASSALLA